MNFFLKNLEYMFFPRQDNKSMNHLDHLHLSFCQCSEPKKHEKAFQGYIFRVKIFLLILLDVRLKKTIKNINFGFKGGRNLDDRATKTNENTILEKSFWN